jgi:hypothetical protein
MVISAKSTQTFVPIKEVRDGVVVLKDGSLRAIMLASSINLSLKSAEEQKAIIFQFQSFLNTLDFHAQIVVQSRRLDIRPYIVTLENRMKVLSEPLLKLQTKEYIDFIKNFTETVAVMTKSFFVVVPYTHINIKTETKSLRGILSKKYKDQASAAKQADFEEQRSQLEQRISVIEQGLARCGIKSVQLGTEEVVEVFYKVFNPGEQESRMHVEDQA